MAHQQRAPQYTHSFIDSCAFDPGGIEEAASRRILEKWPNIIVAHSVQKELDHPNTPDDVKRMAQTFLYTIESSRDTLLISSANAQLSIVSPKSRMGRGRDSHSTLDPVS